MSHRSRVLVFQHRAHVTPAHLAVLLDADPETDWLLVHLDEGDPIPRLEDFDALIVLGAPMDVWDTAEFPWLETEKAAVRRWVRELDRPYLGMCFGHQMLAHALDGECARQVPPAVGMFESRLTESGRTDPIFEGLPDVIPALQWNMTCVATTPPDATILATSPIGHHQAMRVGRHAWSWQWHIEIDATTVRSWGAVPAHAAVAIDAFGVDGVEALAVAADARMTEMNDHMGRLYANFMASVQASIDAGVQDA